MAFEDQNRRVTWEGVGMSHHVIKLTYPVSLKFHTAGTPSVVYVVRGFFCVEPATQNHKRGCGRHITHPPWGGGEKPFKPVRRTQYAYVRSIFSSVLPTGWSEWRRSGQIGWPYQPIQGLRFGFLRVGDEPSVFPRTARLQFSLCVCVCDRDSGGGEMRAVAVVNSTFLGVRHGRANVAPSDASPLRRYIAPRPNGSRLPTCDAGPPLS